MKSKIGLVWQGVDGRYGKWRDGLWAALKILEKKYDIEYIEPTADLSKYDVLLYWEAPCTINGEFRENYMKIMYYGCPKALLFAGGQIMKEWVDEFDAVCVESQINVQDFNEIYIDTTTAFGINTKVFKPYNVKKKYKAVHHGTCAMWKRQDLLAKTFGKDALLIGRDQESDPLMFQEARILGAEVKDELYEEDLAKAVCSADVLVQSSDFWGGGQRCTLEAMAAGLPVICMSDSPKNMEYVEESGAGLVCDPNPEAIQEAYDKIMKDYKNYSQKGIKYVKSKWTEQHYADNLEKVICTLLKKSR